MPIVPSLYQKRPWYFFNAHLETIIPSLFFKVEGVIYERERLELNDGDLESIAGGVNESITETSSGWEYVSETQ